MERENPEKAITLDGLDLFHSYRMFSEHHVLPWPGGLYEQPALFLQVVDICDAGRAVYFQRKEENESKMKLLQEKMKRRMQGNQQGK